MIGTSDPNLGDHLLGSASATWGKHGRMIGAVEEEAWPATHKIRSRRKKILPTIQKNKHKIPSQTTLAIGSTSTKQGMAHQRRKKIKK